MHKITKEFAVQEFLDTAPEVFGFEDIEDAILEEFGLEIPRRELTKLLKANGYIRGSTTIDGEVYNLFRPVDMLPTEVRSIYGDKVRGEYESRTGF